MYRETNIEDFHIFALEEFISPLGKQQANSRLTWPPSKISFSHPTVHIYIYLFSQLRDQPLRRYSYNIIQHE